MIEPRAKIPGFHIPTPGGSDSVHKSIKLLSVQTKLRVAKWKYGSEFLIKQRLDK